MTTEAMQNIPTPRAAADANPIFSIEFQVRDYEVDMAGGVNNAVYLHYLEHARLAYLKSLGINYAYWTKQKIGFVLARVELDFRFSLVNDDLFVVKTRVERVSRLRFRFFQDIFRLPDEKPILNAVLLTTAVDAKNRPTLPKEIAAIMDIVCPVPPSK